MSAANDLLFDVEGELDKYPPGTPGWAGSRRLILRKALEKAESEGRSQGYSDAKRDVAEAALAEKEWDRSHGEKEEPDA